MVTRAPAGGKVYSNINVLSLFLPFLVGEVLEMLTKENVEAILVDEDVLIPAVVVVELQSLNSTWTRTVFTQTSGFWRRSISRTLG